MEAVRARLEHGSNVKAAKVIGISRVGFIHRLHMAAERGLIEPMVNQANPSRWRPVEEAIAAHKVAHARLKASVKPGGNVIFRPDDLPFMLIVLGDEHWDDEGTDLDLFEYWISFLDRGKHRTGISVGDLLNNWPKALAFLWAQQESSDADAFNKARKYIHDMGDDMDAYVWGNHDSWQGAHFLFAEMARDYSALQEMDELRWAYRCPSGREITVQVRHKWPGSSMYNEVHAIKRAAMMGERDTILIGGHLHISGEARDKHRRTGQITHCFQVASFKVVDAYARQLGLADKHMSPAVALVIDPRLPDNDPDLVQVFHDPARAADTLTMLRRQAKRAIA